VCGRDGECGGSESGTRGLDERAGNEDRAGEDHVDGQWREGIVEGFATEHGIHVHNVGKCDGPAFTTAGGHFNPTGAHHGVKNAQEPRPHAGDLENLTVGQNGKANATFMISGVTLGDGQNSLFHEGGTALVIHAKADDLMSDPSGNSGDRIACGVIEK
jgi:superoxide dismutase, Cu-Zn family